MALVEGRPFLECVWCFKTSKHFKVIRTIINFELTNRFICIQVYFKMKIFDKSGLSVIGDIIVDIPPKKRAISTMAEINCKKERLTFIFFRHFNLKFFFYQNQKSPQRLEQENKSICNRHCASVMGKLLLMAFTKSIFFSNGPCFSNSYFFYKV